MARSLSEIARDIRRDWKNVYFGAEPYLDAMSDLDSVADSYGGDSGASIVRYFLTNASRWKGPTATAIKAELNAMIKGKYAAEDLRCKVIRLAHANPILRPHLLPLLKEADLRQKPAARDTMDFVTWALKSQDPIPTNRVIDFLERMGVEQVVDSGENKRGKPLAKGELVEIQAKNAPSDLRDLLEPHDLKKGNIVDVDGNDVVIKLQAGPLLRVPGGVNAGKASGVYRTSQMEDQGSMKHIEVVYLAANERKPSGVAIQVLQKYVENGMAAGEDRSENYFSGFVPGWKVSKDGNPYFMLWSQQRGGRPRTLSPNKGTVYYIGIVGRRPAGWQDELERALEAEGASAAV